MSEPLIRRAGSADAEILAAIGAETFAETFGHLYPRADLEAFLAEAYDLERTRAALADPRQAAWLVEARGRAVGSATAGPCALPRAEVTPDCGELKRFYLLRPWQNGGVGRRLFADVIGWLQSEGPRTVWIGVWSENLGAQRFYGREGFEKVGEYGFRVGETVDREYILRRSAESFSTAKPRSAAAKHNPA